MDKQAISKYIDTNYKRFGEYPFGHAFFWAKKGNKRECVGYAPGCADLNGLAAAVKQEFDLDSVWFNLD